jgi:hypothetical protein
MQTITGYLFVLGGLVLAGGQTVALLRQLFGDERMKIEGVGDFVSALVEKLPAAAVALAFTWFGAYLLRWQVGPPA